MSTHRTAAQKAARTVGGLLICLTYGQAKAECFESVREIHSSPAIWETTDTAWPSPCNLPNPPPSTYDVHCDRPNNHPSRFLPVLPRTPLSQRGKQGKA